MKSKWQSFVIGLIGFYFVLISYILTPEFIDNYILYGILLNKTVSGIVKNLGTVVFLIGFIIILFGIILAKWPTLFSRATNPCVRGYFDYKNIFMILSGFSITFISMHIMVKVVRRYIQFDAGFFWPISQVMPQIPDLQHLFGAMTILLLFFFSIKYLSKTQYRLLFIIIFSIFLVLGTNLLQSQGWEGKSLLKSNNWDAGFVVPIIGSSKIGTQYYHDAIKITDVVYFVNNYENIQPFLLTHARTHPPGAILSFYTLLRIFKNPVLISIVLGILSVSLSIFFLYNILSIEFKEDISKYMALLFIIIPSIQIYYVASIDALITSFLLGFLYFYLKKRSAINIIGSVFFLFMASFLTFAFLFILPIMIGYEFLVRKDFVRSGCIILGVGLIYAFIYIIFDFNYINSFMIASALENPDGFMLFSQPASYLFTRIEGIFEIIFFFGPFLSFLMVLGLHTKKRINSNLLTLTWLAILSLLAMLGTGAFRTGETARVAIFIYPFLIFPVASYLQTVNFSLKDRNTLLYLVFTQSILMQIFGFFYW